MSFAKILDDLRAQGQGKLDKKLPSWSGRGVTVPSSLNLEQCSSEGAAMYKAGLIPEGARVADLTGGLGADSWAFARRARAVWYNERDSVLLEAVRHNFAALGVSGVEYNGYDISLSDPAWKESLAAFRPDVIYLDPARRSAAGKKVFLLEDCSPDVVGLMPVLLALAPMVMVKVSSMADLTMLQRRLSDGLEELHVVGLGGECKEVLCICRPGAVFSRVVLFEDGFVLDAPVPECRQSGCSEGQDLMLFVPSAALTKSGLGPGICLTGYQDSLSHFGKYWQVIENLPFASSAIRDLGRRYQQAEVTARGVPLSSEELRSRLRVKSGGSVHIFACTLSGERRLVVCR